MTMELEALGAELNDDNEELPGYGQESGGEDETAALTANTGGDGGEQEAAYSPGMVVVTDEAGNSARLGSPQDRSKKSSPHSASYRGHSTLKRKEQAWLDPWEVKVKKDTFAKNTLETLRPHFAERTQRAALTDLDEEFFAADPDMELDEEEVSVDHELNDDAVEMEMNENSSEETKLGTWDGVFANCLLNIFGVIMFLRVGWVVGQAGIGGALGIMSISTVVTTLTALSMSAIATNGTVAGGGAYYLISRSLGPAIGGSVGLLFSLGNMVAVSMYLIGFSETLVANIGGGDSIMTGDVISDVRVISMAMLCLVMLLALGGLKYVMKVQLGLLVFICFSILCLFIGSFYQTSKEKLDEDLIDLFDNCLDTLTEKEETKGKVNMLYGVAGWSNGNLADNMVPKFSKTAGVKYDFFTTLSVFFPAVTGIMAGANISGDLDDPSVNIPNGTLTAIGVTSVVYMALAVFVGAVTSRCALLNDYLIMTQISVWEYLVLIGIYCATASSAIASLVGAPRILQKIAEDKLFGDNLDRFAELDSGGNPIKGYYLSFLVAFCCCGIGELNFVAPLITTFFMLAYTLINFSCFALETGKTPGWRPSFRYFNQYTALLGAILCGFIMFMMSWIYSLGGCCIAGMLYYYILYKDPKVDWGAAGDSRAYYDAYKALVALKGSRLHVKNWRPGFLVLTKDPLRRPHMILFAQTLKKSFGPVVYATIRTGDYREVDMLDFREKHGRGYLPEHKLPKPITGFYECVLADSFRNGNQMLLQCAGLGGIRPNTLVMGFTHSWKKPTKDVAKRQAQVKEYVSIVKDSLNMGFGVMLTFNFRSVNWLQDNFVPVPTMYEEDDGVFEDIFADDPGMKKAQSHDMDITSMTRGVSEGTVNRNHQQRWGDGQGMTPIIDVWWLLNTGGLLPLIPHILKLHKFWSKCKLRINVLVDSNDISSELKDTEELISKFRLRYEEVRKVDLERNDPLPSTISYFEKYADVGIDSLSRPAVLKRWLRVSELMMEHCRYSGLVVCTLPAPMPEDPPSAYMALLEVLARPKRMPPMMLLRGANVSALTWMSE